MSKLLSFTKKNKYFLLGILVPFLVIITNAFPEGYIISSTDTSQPLNVSQHFLETFFSTPSYFLFLLPFYFLDFLRVSPAAQLSFLVGFFIFGSYFSFYLFTRLFFEKSSDFLRSSVSLFYALNLFTLYIFTMHALGYTHFFFLYVFLPLLFGFFLKFITKQKFIYLALFCLTLFLASPGFGNPAFFLSFLLAILVLTGTLFLVKKIKLTKKLLFQMIILAFISFLVSSFWFLPTLPITKSGVENLNTVNPTNFDWALRTMGNPLSYSLGLNHFSHDYFPFNFPYEKLLFLKNYFLLASFLPIFVVLLSFIFFKKLRYKKLFLMALIIFLFLISLNAKIGPPFEKINYYFFHIWGINTLRAYDKIAIVVPFFLAFIFLVSLKNLMEKKKKKLAVIIMLLILLTPLPFYLGKFQQNLSMRFANLSPEDKDFRTSRLTFLVKIPEEYNYIKKRINSDPQKAFIATLPNNLGNSGTGSSNYPAWKLNGIDVTQYIYNKKFIEANLDYFPNWYFTDEFNQLNTDPEWLVETLGIMNAKYILYHLDAPPGEVSASLWKMRVLEERGRIKNLEENDYFILYEIKPAYVLPYLTYQKEKFEWRNDPVWIERHAQRIVDASIEASSREINPKKFEIDFKNSSWSKNIILAEKFDPLWKAYAIQENGKKYELKNHFLARGYANGWQIENGENIEKIIIEYYPTRLMWWGIWLSGLTVLFLIGYLIRYYRKSKVLKSKVENNN